MTRDDAPRDRLDLAIDHVAGRMVHVEDDADMAMRIAEVLPERSRFGWLIPQLALLTACAIAAIVWTTRTTPAPVALLPASPVNIVATLSSPAVPHESAYAREYARELRRDSAVAAFGREGGPLEPVEPLEVWDGLPSLVVSDVTPRDLPLTPALTLEPIGVASIEVADLKLTAESFPQKEE